MYKFIHELKMGTTTTTQVETLARESVPAKSCPGFDLHSRGREKEGRLKVFIRVQVLEGKIIVIRSFTDLKLILLQRKRLHFFLWISEFCRY